MIIKVMFFMERVKETIHFENCKGGDGMKHFKNVQNIDFLQKCFSVTWVFIFSKN